MRYEYAVGESLEEMRENVRNSSLMEFGDAKLIWANEGDLYMASSQAGRESTLLACINRQDMLLRVANTLVTSLQERPDTHNSATLRKMEEELIAQFLEETAPKV